MLDFEEEESETDVHFDRAMLERLHRRGATMPREGSAWLLAPDEDARPLPASGPAQEPSPETWRPFLLAVRRLVVR